MTVLRTGATPGSVSAVPASPRPAPGLRPQSVAPYPLARLAGLLAATPRRGERDGKRDGDRDGKREAAGEAIAATTVTGVAFDSRSVRPGDLYVALPGAHTHGARFVPAVLKQGAVAVLTDPAGAELTADDVPVPVLVVDDPRRAMAIAAAEVYGRPATRLTMIGVTGTNGKTTTSYLLAAALRATGRHVGLIGTLGYFLDGEEIAADRTTITTPESADLQALLARLAELGADSVVMEVSSHALALGRADEIIFDVAGFTNFGRDHLDFHGTVQAYFEAKAQLFTAAHARRAVINIDDERGPELVARASADGLEVVTTSVTGAAGDGVHDHFGTVEVGADADPVPVRIATPAGELDFRLGLPGTYNVANAITACAMLDRIGVDLRTAVTGLASVRVPGRLQRVDLGAGPRAYVDFAHTPQAVRSVLAELRTVSSRTGAGGRLICVVGCGGDRDPDKRGPMGAAAADLADVVIITDDNPRTEDPATIRAAALAGAREQAARSDRPVQVVDGGDRAAAIRLALRQAGADDVIAVLGKGHERGQEIAGEILPFDDAEQLIAARQELIGSTRAEG